MRLINTSIPLHHQQFLLNHSVITMQFLLLFLTICQFVQGHGFSLKESCSTEDFHKCGSCTSLGCKIGDNFIGSFTNVTTAEDCKGWCRKRNDYMHDCKYLTYYGKEGVTFQNTCYIFTSWRKKSYSTAVLLKHGTAPPPRPQPSLRHQPRHRPLLHQVNLVIRFL